ncbi:MAG: DUF4440 domain-containing protein [Gemmatimonadota bacterium]|nr:DUF4440 domain-containing protein [Gemmatimonadota bacterium]
MTLRFRSLGSLFLLGSLITATACAPVQPAAPQDSAALEAIIEATKLGWENADGTPFREHFLDFPGARYVETGGQNEGLDDLVTNHVEPEGEALEGLTLTYSNIETHFEGNFAWALTDVRVQATVRSSGNVIDRTGYQTFLFRWVEDAWKVVHTHNSTRAPR